MFFNSFFSIIIQRSNNALYLKLKAYPFGRSISSHIHSSTYLGAKLKVIVFSIVNNMLSKYETLNSIMEFKQLLNLFFVRVL